jgi:hypothetical protein
MDVELKAELERARQAAAEARRLVEAAERGGVPPTETARRRRELDRLEDVGRSAVLECLEQGQPALARTAAQGLAAAIEDEGLRAARDLVLVGRAAEAR